MSAIGEGVVVGITIKAIDEFSKTFDKATSGLGKFSSLAKGAVAGIATMATATVGLATAFVDLGVKGSEYADFQGEFNRMVGTDAPNVLNKLKSATLGAVSELDLFNTSNKIMASGIGANSLPMLADFATRLGETTKEFGGVSDIMQTVGQSIATGRFVQLEQMLGGIDLKGKSTAEILDLISQKMEGMPKPMEDAGSKMEKLKAAFQDVTLQLGAELEPVVSQFLDVITQLMPAIQPLIAAIVPFAKQLFAMLVPVINKLLPFITSLITTLLPPLIDIFFQILNALMPILPVLMQVVEAIIPPLVEILNMAVTLLPTIVSIIVELLPAILPLLPPLFEIIKFILRIFQDILPVSIPILIDIIKNILPILTDALNLVVWVIEKVEPIIKAITKAMTTVVSTIQKIISIIRTLIDVAKQAGVSVGSLIGGAFNKLFGKKQIGGMITATGSYMLEKGEMVVPRRNAEQGGGVTININGNMYGVDADDMAVALQKKLNFMVKM